MNGVKAPMVISERLMNYNNAFEYLGHNSMALIISHKNTSILKMTIFNVKGVEGIMS